GGGRRGGGFRTAAGPSVQYRTVTPEEMEDLFGEAGGFGDMFGSIFGGGRARSRVEASEVETPITVSLTEVYRGTSRTVGLPDPKGGPAGDLYAEVKVQLPVPMDDRTREWASEQPR